ncbi:gamma-glutamyltransferase [Streptomyces sp. L7]
MRRPRGRRKRHGRCGAASGQQGRCGSASSGGGNAVDAAVARATRWPWSTRPPATWAAAGFMTIQLADGRKTFLDFREKCAAGRHGQHVPRQGRQRHQGRCPRKGHLAVGVPGTVSGMEYARQKYGTMQARCTDRAGHCAGRQGLRRSTRATSTCCTRRPRTSRRTPASGAIFLNKGQAVPGGREARPA